MTRLDSEGTISYQKNALTITGTMFNGNVSKFTVCGVANLNTSLVSLSLHAEEVSSFSLSLPKNKDEGLIAIKIRRKGTFWGTLNRVYRDSDGKVFVDTEKPFIPDSDRLIQFYDDGTLEIAIGKVIYTNQIKNSSSRYEQRLVDGNLLCQYALGEIDSEGLLRAVEEVKRKFDELAAYKKLVVEKQTEIHEIRDRADGFEKEKTALILWGHSFTLALKAVSGGFFRKDVKAVYQKCLQARPSDNSIWEKLNNLGKKA